MNTANHLSTRWAIFVIICCQLVLAARANAATVRMADDSVISGEVVFLAGGKLVIRTDTGKNARSQTIALADVVQVTWRPPPPSPAEAATPQPQDQQEDSSPSFWSILFGGRGRSAASPPADQVAAPAPPPNAMQPAGSIRWHVMLTGGDSLHGRITAWSDQKLAVSLENLEAPSGSWLSIPCEQLAELWTGPDAERAKAESLLAGASDSANDIAFVRKGSDLVLVKGIVLGITGDALQFRFGDQVRKIALDRLAGLIMDKGGRKTLRAVFRQSFAFHGGDRLIGKWVSLADGNATVQTDWGQPVRLPIADVDWIDCLDGRVVYVSDLTPVKVEQEPFFGRVIPFRIDCGLDGGSLRLSDGVCSRGIAVHSRCVLDYAIGGKFERFTAKVGFAQPEGLIGRAAIRILADGKPIYDNPDTRGDAKPVALDVSIAGAQTLTLEVDFGKGDDAGGRIIWGNARLLRDLPAQ